MKTISITIALAACLLLVARATPYQHLGLGGGFTDKQIAPKPCRLSCRTAVTVTGVNGSHVRRDENGGKGGGQELRGLTRPGGYELARLPVAQLPPLRTVEPFLT